MSKTQIIYGDDGAPAFAVVPYDLFTKLRLPEDESALSDEELYDLAKADDSGPAVPDAVMARLIAGENAVKVFREWRDLTQHDLAERTGLTTGYISQIERGSRPLSRKARMTIADALEVPFDDLD